MEEPLAMAREFDLVSSWAHYLTTTRILQAWFFFACHG
jgi:hypothetical protein